MMRRRLIKDMMRERGREEQRLGNTFRRKLSKVYYLALIKIETISSLLGMSCLYSCVCLVKGNNNIQLSLVRVYKAKHIISPPIKTQSRFRQQANNIHNQWQCVSVCSSND